MIREIVKDPVFLQQKSLPATEADLSTGATARGGAAERKRS